MADMRPRDLPECCTPPTGPPSQAVFIADDEAPRQARRYVREVLDNDDAPLKAERLSDVLLVVSELVTNGYRYGTEPGDSLLVKILTSRETIRVEVHDPRRKRPHL